MKGDHAMNCSHGGGRRARHDALKAYFSNLVTAAGLSIQTEPLALIDGKKQCPADFFITGLPIGATGSTYDVTVVNPLQKAFIKANCHIPAIVTTDAKEKKQNKYQDQLKKKGIIFFTLVFKSLGGWDPSTVGQVKAITTLMAGRHAPDEVQVYKHAFQHMSIVLMWGNTC